jgi:hypothetical protein
MSALNESVRLCRDPFADDADAAIAQAGNLFKDQVRPLVVAGDENFIGIDWNPSVEVADGWNAEEAGPTCKALRER